MGGGHHEALPEGPASRKEMADAGLMVAYRDACAHLLIPLNKSAFPASRRRARARPARPGGGAKEGGDGTVVLRRRCRRKTFYMPWECGHLRHEYEKCQYVEWLKRSKDEKVRAEAESGHH